MLPDFYASNKKLELKFQVLRHRSNQIMARHISQAHHWQQQSAAIFFLLWGMITAHACFDVCFCRSTSQSSLTGERSISHCLTNLLLPPVSPGEPRRETVLSSCIFDVISLVFDISVFMHLRYWRNLPTRRGAWDPWVIFRNIKNGNASILIYWGSAVFLNFSGLILLLKDSRRNRRTLLITDTCGHQLNCSLCPVARICTCTSSVGRRKHP